jgi:DNA-binding CsgD family transcriptional regulator
MALEVVGREEELAVVRAGLDDVQAGAAAVIVGGEAGIGKTTLWLAGIAAAEERGFRVLVSRPAEAEMELGYVGLTDLLAPVLDEILDELTSPQRRALEVALLRSEPGGEAPDQAAIGFALLGAVVALARRQPVLLAVDDVQWLDASSSFALRFAARRLGHESVGLLLCARTELGSWLSEERTRRIEVGPLSLGALHHLVQTRLNLALARPTLQRLHEASAGNPFFALELARTLDESRLHEPLPISGELRQLLADRLAGLPEDAEQALLFAAAASHPTIALIGEAAGEDTSLQPAIDAELIELDGSRIRFVHPLLASVVYSEADAGRKRAVHSRLAAVVEDLEERARHLALCTEEPDAEVAATLDEAARVARGRGAPQAAAALSEQALRLTRPVDAELGHRRRLAAGAAHFEAGDTARAHALFTEAADLAVGRQPRAEALSRLAWVDHYAGDQRVAVRLFRECLSDAEDDSSLRHDAAVGLASGLFFLREDLGEALRHARSAARTAEREQNRAGLADALGLQGVIEAVLGRRAAAQTLEAASDLEEWARNIPLVRRPSFESALARVWFDDFGGARAELERTRENAVAQGDESSLPFILTYLSFAEFLLGRWREAMQAADDGAQIALLAGQGIGRAYALSARALVLSCLGREEAARAEAAEALALAERGAMLATTTSQWALALLELSLDQPKEAHEALGPLVDHYEAAGIGEPGSMRFVPDEIEALVALGERDQALERLKWYESHALRLRRRSALAAAHRCRGLLADAPDDAFSEFGRALEELEQLPMPFERARTLLALGSALRRANQRRNARETLGTALKAFEVLGGALWIERTRTELRRISGRAPSPGELTASEKRVAELVAAGRTNREVAAALYVTPRTVEGTLSRVYSKLGVRSRTELARRWAARES